MAFIQRRPHADKPLAYTTTIGMNKSLLVVGLGNPGEEYEGSRHNIGFMCLDYFAKKNDFGSWQTKKELKSEITAQTLGDTRVILCKPQTFMNLSGEAVQAVQRFYKLDNAHTVVVHDELDISFGQIRMRGGGSAAGNNGVKSVSQHVGEDYARVRIGIGPKQPEQMDAADFVLQDFSKAEQASLPAMQREVAAILSEYAYGAAFTPETRSFL